MKKHLIIWNHNYNNKIINYIKIEKWQKNMKKKENNKYIK